MFSDSKRTISFLLGAGFSAPIGYPIGNELNQLLLKSRNENIAFSSEGSLVVAIDGSKPDLGYKSSHQIDFEFACEVMDYYSSVKKEFDYEEFYDYAVSSAFHDPDIKKISEPFLDGDNSVHSLISSLKKVLNQLVSYFLKDGEGSRYYDDQPYLLDKEIQGYTGILNYISDLMNDSTIHIHTLNHDLFFERFNNSEFFRGRLCDGFEELGSPFFGKLKVNNRQYKVRLERYTGSYSSNFRLYKLHGSRDYEIFHKIEGGLIIPDVYIKTRYGIGHTDHYKEVINKQGYLEYQNSWINYHGDFLTGTSSKVLRYNEPLLFSRLFEYFQSNLEQSDALIIVGYGAKDIEVNRMIFQHFNFPYNKVFIIDPFPSKRLIDFGLKLKAKFITKQIGDIIISDLK